MKIFNYLLCLILIFISTVSFSQHQLVDPSNQWNILYTQAMHGNDRWTVKYTFSEDSTLIDGSYYYELLRTEDEDGEINSETGIYYRQEGEKVWMKDGSDSSKLLYDFSLEEGDTFAMENIFNVKESYIVTETSTVEFMDGSSRKLLKLEGGTVDIDCSREWVRGMGSLFGFMQDIGKCTFDGTGSDVLCFKHKGEILYRDDSESSCYIVADENAELNTINIYPNPAIDKLHIETDRQIQSVIIYNTSSQKIMEVKYPEKTLDISELNTGVYILHIEGTDGAQGTTKFIKN